VKFANAPKPGETDNDIMLSKMLQTFAAAVVCMAGLSTALTTTVPATTTLDVKDKSVQFTMSVIAVSYTKINGNAAFTTAFEGMVRTSTKDALSAVQGVVDKDITMTLSTYTDKLETVGLLATVTVAPESEASVKSIMSSLDGSEIGYTLTNKIKAHKDVAQMVMANKNTTHIFADQTKCILVAGGRRADRTSTTRSPRTTTTTLDVKKKSVQFVLTCAALDFAKVSGDGTLKAWYIAEVKKEVGSISSGYGVVEADIKVELSAGSVKATVTVAPDKEARVKFLLNLFTKDMSFLSRLARSVQVHKALDKMLASGKKKADVSVTKNTPTLVAGGPRIGRETDGSVPGSVGATAVVSSSSRQPWWPAALVAGSLALMASF